MNLNKKLILSFSLTIFLTSCYSNSIPTITGSVNFSKISQPIKIIKNNNESIIADLGDKSGVNLSFKMNLFGFYAKSNKSGGAMVDTSAIQSVRVWLVELPTGSSPITPGVTVNPVTGFSYDNSSVNQTITFTNVPANGSSMSYYVAVSAFNVLSGGITGPNQNSGNNITNATSATNFIMINGNTPAALSQGGGETVPSNRLGSLTVGSSPNYIVSTTNGLTVNLKLLDEVGANVETNISIANGTAGIGSINYSNLAGNIDTVAGNGTANYSGDGGDAKSATLNLPYDVITDNLNNIYIADTSNCVIRKVDATTKIITTVAGTGTCGSSGDGGSATNAQLNYPKGLAIDNNTNTIYVADTLNHAIRSFTVGGNMTTVAGQLGNPGSFGDGTFATLANLNTPISIALDSSNNIYIADTINNKIRRVTSGFINTIAGTGTAGSSGDGGYATSADLNNPSGVFIDDSSNIYIADTNNHVIRKFTVGGSINTVVGTLNSSGSSGDGGVASNALLNSPFSVFKDSIGNIYINDRGNKTIRKVNATNNMINIYAGINGSASYNGDGIQATSANLNNQTGIFVDKNGSLYISDYNNNRIRKVL